MGIKKRNDKLVHFVLTYSQQIFLFHQILFVTQIFFARTEARVGNCVHYHALACSAGLSYCKLRSTRAKKNMRFLHGQRHFFSETVCVTAQTQVLGRWVNDKKKRKWKSWKKLTKKTIRRPRTSRGKVHVRDFYLRKKMARKDTFVFLRQNDRSSAFYSMTSVGWAVLDCKRIVRILDSSVNLV